MADQPPERQADHDAHTRILRIDEVTARPTTVKCMGRTYAATAVADTVQIQDLTDITNPRPVGSARPSPGNGSWEIQDPRGAILAETADLLHALSLLRQAQWPPRDLLSAGEKPAQRSGEGP
ncbi:hypothetical protein [Kitasatospora sp. LaBMicrA B282]|uniref:hypothetical protein n=1 Tax=Kitasatospora sp. LaBMicrA B282 TaxID=3420949 RepID=UPI003D098613